MSLPRRTFLRGAGCHAGAAAARCHGPGADGGRADARPRRRCASGFIYVPNGVIVSDWTPAGDRRRTSQLSPMPDAARAVSRPDARRRAASRIGRRRRWATAAAITPARSAVWLNGVHAEADRGRRRSGGDDRRSDRRADAGPRHAAAVARAGVSKTTFMIGNCDNGYSCAYSNTISWRTPTTPLPVRDAIRACVFERMFGEGGTGDRARRSMRAEPQHPGFGQRGNRRACSRRLGAARPRPHRTSISRPCAKSSGGFSARKAQRRIGGAAAADAAGRHPGNRSTSMRS